MIKNTASRLRRAVALGIALGFASTVHAQSMQTLDPVSVTGARIVPCSTCFLSFRWVSYGIGWDSGSSNWLDTWIDADPPIEAPPTHDEYPPPPSESCAGQTALFQLNGCAAVNFQSYVDLGWQAAEYGTGHFSSIWNPGAEAYSDCLNEGGSCDVQVLSGYDDCVSVETDVYGACMEAASSLGGNNYQWHQTCSSNALTTRIECANSFHAGILQFSNTAASLTGAATLARTCRTLNLNIAQRCSN